MRVNRRQALELLKEEQDFEISTGSMRGINFVKDGQREYVVYSYREPIARVQYVSRMNVMGDVEIHRHVWITDKKFSVTTSTHTGMARRSLQVA